MAIRRAPIVLCATLALLGVLYVVHPLPFRAGASGRVLKEEGDKSQEGDKLVSKVDDAEEEEEEAKTTPAPEDSEKVRPTNASQVADGEENASHSAGMTNASSQAAGDGPKEASSQTSADADETSFSTLLHLREMPPYWFLALSTVAKPIFTILVFGPPKPVAPEGSSDGFVTKTINLMKGLVQVGFIAMVFQTIVVDFGHIKDVFQSNMNFWEKINGAMLATSISPNLLSAAAAMSLSMLYQQTIDFVWAHERALDNEHLVDEENAESKSMGRLTQIYVYTLILLYALPLAALGCYVAPAVTAYFYITLPFMFIVLAFIMTAAEYFPWMLSKVKGSSDYELLKLDPEKHEQQKRLIIADLKTKEFGGNEVDYEAEVDAFNRSGVPQAAWVQYFMWPPGVPIIMVMVPVAVRLYTGRGYWAALTSTFQERTTHAYFGDLSLKSALVADIAVELMKKGFVNYLL